MGTKYAAVSVSGYNATPPVDDGTVSEANKVKWSTIKTKLPDPLKTALESIDSNLQTHFNVGPTALTSNTTLGASHYNQLIQVSGAGVTLTLSDAATLAAGWFCRIVNTDSTNAVTIARATAGDTINGSAANITLSQLSTIDVFVIAAANGFKAITFTTADNTQTLTNKTLTAPVISIISNTGTVTLFTATDTVVGKATTDTLTNKTVNLSSNTLSGTTAQFNTALSDNDFATLAGTETFTNKTITSPVINSATGIGQAVVKRKTADESVTSSTTLQDDDHLTFSIAANEEWSGSIMISCGAGLSTTGFKVALTTPSGATLEAFAYSQADNAAAAVTSGRTTTSGANILSFASFTAGSNGVVIVNFWILNSTNAGSITLQWAQGTSSGTALTFFKGSFLVAKRIA